MRITGRIIGSLGLLAGLCFATSGLANNQPNSQELPTVCSCMVSYDADWNLRNSKDSPFLSEYDGLKPVIPEQVVLPDSALYPDYKLVRDPKSGSTIAVLDLCNQDAGSRPGGNSAHGLELADTIAEIAPVETSSNFGAAAVAPAIGLIETTVAQAAVVGTRMVLFGQGDETASR